MTEWKPVTIAPYRKYVVSDQGDVRRVGSDAHLQGYVNRYGYRTVLLSYAGLKRRFAVHRLVCLAFHGEATDGKEVCHRNGDRSDNRAANLRWGTRSENVRDAIAHGTYRAPPRPSAEQRKRGDEHPFAKLTEAVVREARARWLAGESGNSLAREYGVTSANMNAALRGATWAHVDAESDVPKGNPVGSQIG